MVLKVVTTKTSAVDHDDSMFKIKSSRCSGYKVRPNMVKTWSNLSPDVGKNVNNQTKYALDHVS